MTSSSLLTKIITNSVIEKISPKIDNKLKALVKSQVEEESQVVVHITFAARQEDMMIRIWPSTYLFTKHSNHISELLFADNITLHPYWTPMTIGKSHTFSLIFQGLPKSCKYFDLIEVIPENGGFEIKNIERNKTDIYYLKM